MKTFYANSRNDICETAQRLLDMHESLRPNLAAYIMANGMMRTSWWLHLAIRIAKWRHGYSPLEAWYNLFNRVPQVADELIEQTADWIMNGKDADGEGIGGFNQRELNRLNSVLSW